MFSSMKIPSTVFLYMAVPIKKIKIWWTAIFMTFIPIMIKVMLMKVMLLSTKKVKVQLIRQNNTIICFSQPKTNWMWPTYLNQAGNSPIFVVITFIFVDKIFDGGVYLNICRAKCQLCNYNKLFMMCFCIFTAKIIYQNGTTKAVLL